MITKIIYSIALSISILTFILCLLSNISLFTSIIRSLIVFVGVLFIFFIASAVMAVALRPKEIGQKENVEQAKKEEGNKVNAE
ncbi:MAG: hypothetical protein H0Z29_03330 [Candidatus Marinimicrobia bacterium]|nr:hypothetical protein [Candidatus Neomarinimicrobiota bacterium]